jgi:SAM-dependent methyltransferase
VSNESSCLLCRASESTLVQKGARHAPELEVRRCQGCDFVFLAPRASAAELDAYYAQQYRADYGEPPVEERYRSDLDEARMRVRRLLPFLRAETRLLEVGSGSGAFLDSVKPYVGEAVGLEPDERSRRWIRERLGLLMPERLAGLLEERKTFDLVVMFHVLEHVGDPIAFLESLRPLVRAGGVLVVEVPNVDDALVSLYEVPTYRPFYYQKAHLSYFSKATLALALARAGFRATIEGLQRYDLSNHIRWMLTGRPGGHGHYSGVFTPALLAAYAGALVEADRADTLWALAGLKEPVNRGES